MSNPVEGRFADDDQLARLEDNSLASVKETLDSYNWVAIRKEIDFWFARTKLFSPLFPKNLHDFKVKMTPEHIRYYMLSHIAIEKDALVEPSILLLIEMIKLRAFKDKKIMNAFAEFREERALTINRAYIASMPAALIDEIVVLMTPHIECSRD